MSRSDHQLCTVTLGEPPDAWRRAGFRVDDGGRCRLGTTTLVLAGRGEGDVDPPPSWHLADTPPLDGIPTCGRTDDGPSDHPNLVERIDHVVVRSGDGDRTTAAFEAAGLDARGTRATTGYGSPMRQTFFWAGDVIVELIAPVPGDPPVDEPTTIWGLALVSDDLTATAERLGGLLGAPRDAVQPGRRIAGLRGREVGIGLPVAVMSPHPGRADK